MMSSVLSYCWSLFCAELFFLTSFSFYSRVRFISFLKFMDFFSSDLTWF